MSWCTMSICFEPLLFSSFRGLGVNIGFVAIRRTRTAIDFWWRHLVAFTDCDIVIDPFGSVDTCWKSYGFTSKVWCFAENLQEVLVASGSLTPRTSRFFVQQCQAPCLGWTSYRPSEPMIFLSIFGWMCRLKVLSMFFCLTQSTYVPFKCSLHVGWKSSSLWADSRSWSAHRQGPRDTTGKHRQDGSKEKCENPKVNNLLYTQQIPELLESQWSQNFKINCTNEKQQVCSVQLRKLLGRCGFECQFLSLRLCWYMALAYLSMASLPWCWWFQSWSWSLKNPDVKTSSRRWGCFPPQIWASSQVAGWQLFHPMAVYWFRWVFPGIWWRWYTWRDRASSCQLDSADLKTWSDFDLGNAKVVKSLFGSARL